jgi:hypothetical protein
MHHSYEEQVEEQFYPWDLSWRGLPVDLPLCSVSQESKWRGQKRGVGMGREGKTSRATSRIAWTPSNSTYTINPLVVSSIPIPITIYHRLVNSSTHLPDYRGFHKIPDPPRFLLFKGMIVIVNMRIWAKFALMFVSLVSVRVGWTVESTHGACACGEF